MSKDVITLSPEEIVFTAIAVNHFLDHHIEDDVSEEEVKTAKALASRLGRTAAVKEWFEKPR